MRLVNLPGPKVLAHGHAKNQTRRNLASDYSDRLLVFFDALRVKIRDEGLVRNKAVYVALGVTPEGTQDILGLWIETSEGAKFWLRVMTELKNRGVEDILIAVVDGLKGFPEAIVLKAEIDDHLDGEAAAGKRLMEGPQADRRRT
jgi:hypothetical protein